MIVNPAMSYNWDVSFILPLNVLFLFTIIIFVVIILALDLQSF